MALTHAATAPITSVTSTFLITDVSFGDHNTSINSPSAPPISTLSRVTKHGTPLYVPMKLRNGDRSETFRPLHDLNLATLMMFTLHASLQHSLSTQSNYGQTSKNSVLSNQRNRQEKNTLDPTEYILSQTTKKIDKSTFLLPRHTSTLQFPSSTTTKRDLEDLEKLSLSMRTQLEAKDAFSTETPELYSTGSSPSFAVFINNISFADGVDESLFDKNVGEFDKLNSSFAAGSHNDFAVEENVVEVEKNEFDINFFKNIISSENLDGSKDGLDKAENARNTSSVKQMDENKKNNSDAHHKSQVYIMVAVSVAMVVLCFLAVFGLVVVCRRHVMLSKYNSLPSSSHSYFAYDYIYRPLHGNRLDDEYENTFVGVSIPLLQEVTVI